MDMQMNFIRKLPTPKEIKEQFPLPEGMKELKEERDNEIREIFEGKSDKFMLVIGPCSADREDAVIDYTQRLAKVQEQVKDKIFIIPRVYTNKPSYCRKVTIITQDNIHKPPVPRKTHNFL